MGQSCKFAPRIFGLQKHHVLYNRVWKHPSHITCQIGILCWFHISPVGQMKCVDPESQISRLKAAEFTAGGATDFDGDTPLFPKTGLLVNGKDNGNLDVSNVFSLSGIMHLSAWFLCFVWSSHLCSHLVQIHSEILSGCFQEPMPHQAGPGFFFKKSSPPPPCP